MSVIFCARPALAKKLRRDFPKSLHDAPLLRRQINGVRAALEKWFNAHGIRPRIIAEFGDSALMEVCSSGGRGFTVVQTVVDRAALNHYGLRVSNGS